MEQQPQKVKMTPLRRFFHEYFYLGRRRDDQLAVIESIRNGIQFKGYQLWILIFAIFIASLGLNVNSTAVIIGAMLISPLMGPIIGMGMAVGISDFDMLKRSVKNYAVATLFSVLTATIYFALTPLNEVQSELLARTSPTIYDVLIAFFGGLAGILALGTKERGNVVPGVAIATALMPPLCTAGFGVATGNWWYALGAGYLYFINTVFIGVSTFLGVRFMRFPHKEFIDQARAAKVKRYLTIVVVVTMVPAVWMTLRIVRATVYEANANKFINKELDFEKATVIARDIDPQKHAIKVVMLGSAVNEAELNNAKARLPEFGLDGTTLSVIQSSERDSLNVDYLQAMLKQENTTQTEQIVSSQQLKINQLQGKIDHYSRNIGQGRALASEMRTLFPEVSAIGISEGVVYTTDSLRSDTATEVFLGLSKRLGEEDTKRVEEWLRKRMQGKHVNIHIDTAPEPAPVASKRTRTRRR